MGPRESEGTDPAGEERGELEPGTRIGRYEVEERLARGELYTVHAARDPNLGRRVAIKVLRPRLAGDPEARLALLREIQAAARLTAPNLLAVYDAGTSQGALFLAAELVDGETLDRWLAQPRRWRAIVGVFLQAARGLEAAHAAGLVHGHLGPEKMLVGRDGRVRVLDLGLGRLIDGSPGGGEPSGGDHRSPEQRRGALADARSDQYAWAASLHAALFGEVGRGALASPGRRASSRPPRWLRAIVARGMAADPAERHPSIGAAIAAVEGGLARRRRRALAAATGLAIVTATATSFVGYLGGRDEPFGRCPEPSLTPWSAERRRELAAAFAATGVPHAPAAWRSAELGVDRYAARWRSQRREACFALAIGQAAAIDYERRVSCLDRRRMTMEAIIDRIDRPDRALVDHMPKLVGSLPDLEACARPREPEWPSDPGVRTRLTLHFHDLARVSSLIDAGELDEASRAIQPVLRDADQLGFPAWKAEATYLAGKLAARRGVYDEAARVVEEAMWSAEAARHDELAAAAAAELLDILATQQRRPMAARQFVEHARAAAERVGSVAARRRAARAIGWVELAAGRHDQAEAELERAVALDLPSSPADPVEKAELLYDLSTLALRRGRPADAEPLRRRAAALIEAALWPGHPRHAAMVAGHSLALAGADRRAEALATGERAIELYERALGPDHPDLVQPLMTTSEMALDIDDVPRARALAERAVAVAERSMAPDHPAVATALGSLGEAMRIQGELADAERILRRALVIRREQLAPGHHAIVQAALQLAMVLLARGDAAAAGPLCDEALDGAAPLADHAPEMAAIALHCRGHVDVATGHAARGIPSLERAITLLEAAPDPFNVGTFPYWIAWTRFVLTSARPRPSIAEVRASRAVLARRPARYRLELAQIDDWLRRYAR